jgi:hypothetical protein
MSKSRNFDELKHVWKRWHEQSGGKMRDHYEKFVELSNEAARMNSICSNVICYCRQCFILFVYRFQRHGSLLATELRVGHIQGRYRGTVADHQTVLPSTSRLRPGQTPRSLRRRQGPQKSTHTRTSSGQHVGPNVGQYRRLGYAISRENFHRCHS